MSKKEKEKKIHIYTKVRHSVAKYWEIKDKYKSSNPVPRVTVERMFWELRDPGHFLEKFNLINPLNCRRH